MPQRSSTIQQSVRKILYVLSGLFLITVVLNGTPRFISLENGLSNTSIHGFFQDSRNFMWILTDCGLNRISGEDIKVFTQSFTNKHALPNNYLIDFQEDSHGNYWVGTLNGLFRYDPQTETFSSCFTEQYPYISTTKISCILEDEHENVWIVLSGRGLIRIHLTDGRTTLFDLPTINDMDVTTLAIDKGGRIWLAGKHDGIAIFDPKTGILKNLSTLNSTCQQLTTNPIFSLCEDNQGNILAAALGRGLFHINQDTYETRELAISATHPAIRMAISMVKDKKNRIWVGTDGNGLWLLNEKNDKLLAYDSPNYGFNPMKGKVQSLYEDRQGNIWAAYVEKGVLVIPVADEAFKIIQSNPFSGLDFSDQSVTALLTDQDQTLWVGTNGGGLFRLKDRNGSFKLEDKVDIEENVITCLYQDTQGSIYIGTYLHGFYRYDPKSKRMENYRHGMGDKQTVNCNHTTGFAEDREGNLWIATNGGGINQMNIQTNKFTYYRLTDPASNQFLISDWCNCLYIDKQDNLWVGSYAGLSMMNLKTNQIRHFKQSNGKLSNSAVIDILEDANGQIWVATNWGLNKIDKNRSEAHIYTQVDGLPDNIITGLCKDLNGHIWVSTNSGLAQYVLGTESFENYDFHKGPIKQEFKLKTATISTTGNLFWGGTNGIIWFHPDELHNGNSFQGVTLTHFYLFNNSLEVGTANKDHVILDKALSYMKEIRLAYNQNNFSFGFDAFDYINPGMVKYAYRLIGLDEEWQPLKTDNRMATYTNVPPGKYLFQVKAYTSETNIHQIEIGVKVTPPWWLTGWAKSGYILLTAVFIWAIFSIIRARIREKQAMLRKVHDEELTQAKLRFFTDISHEIRTPLTLVISPLPQLLEEEKNRSKIQTYQVMYKNANRILRLVNQLLDIRKIDQKQMKLQVQETNAVAFIADIIDSFQPLFQNKDILLNFELSSQIPDPVWLDIDFMDKIVYNLLSNACKFSPKGGTVSVSLFLSGTETLELRVEDSGCGIPQQFIHSIFDRFYQIPDAYSAKTEMGSGIGLNLTKMLVELHHGKILVSTKENEGSLFTVKVPYQQQDYNPEERKTISNSYFGTNPSEPTYVNEQPDLTLINQDNSSKNPKPTLLIVEDNTDIRSMLKQELQASFHLLEANNGKEGYELAVQHIPHLIITDIMMPIMDGLEMTRKLRNNKNTRQLPIIMLTAKVTSEDSLEGVEAGADVYIPKPFDLRFLRVNITNLLHRQILSKIKYDTEEEVNRNRLDVKSADDKLIERLNNIIKKHINNPDLSIESLSAELGISRVHLHRKLKELCDLTPSIYLRNMRLEYASFLLRTKRITIAEVAYAVGFNSHQYFTNCFKEFYGMSPIEYAEVHRSLEAIRDTDRSSV